MPIAGLGMAVPIRIEENGWPTGTGRSEAQQEQALRSMVAAVSDFRGTYHLTDYRWFDLRDHRTSAPNFQYHYGLLRDDYSEKPAFSAYRELIDALAARRPRDKPKVRMKLRFRRGSAPNEGRCARSRIKLVFAGRDAGAIYRARFKVGKHAVGSDDELPIRGRIPLRPPVRQPLEADSGDDRAGGRAPRAPRTAPAPLLNGAGRNACTIPRRSGPRDRKDESTQMNEEAHQLTTDQAEREASGAHEYGRYLEEFEVGAVYKHWPAKTITESEDHLFCLLTMNHHPLHINDVYASKSQQGRNVVAGPYVYSLMFGMTVNDVSGKAIANLATDELSHPNPVFHGDTLFVESEVLEVRPSESKPDRGVVKVHSRAYNQDGTLVAEFKRAVLVPRKNPG